MCMYACVCVCVCVCVVCMWVGWQKESLRKEVYVHEWTVTLSAVLQFISNVFWPHRMKDDWHTLKPWLLQQSAHFTLCKMAMRTDTYLVTQHNQKPVTTIDNLIYIYQCGGDYFINCITWHASHHNQDVRKCKRKNKRHCLQRRRRVEIFPCAVFEGNDVLW